jgi:hypothetical protein
MIKCIPIMSALLITAGTVAAQAKRFDTTVALDKIGYRVQCSNKSDNENYVSIVPVGFKIDQRNVDFPIRGKVTKAAIDDLNGDGYLDVAIFIYSGPNNDIGTVIGISSVTNKSLVPIFFPDIYTDPKIRDGYKGHDEFSLMAGSLLRKFPLYLPTDAPDKPTGGKRTIQYQVTSEQGRLMFKVLRMFDTKPES